MKDAHLIEAFREDYTTMVVQFADNSMWTYKVLKKDLPNYRPGSYVLVERVPKTQPQPAVLPGHHLAKAYFEEVDELSRRTSSYPHVQAGIVATIHAEPEIDFDADFTYKWVIGPLDMGPYRAVLEADAQLVAGVKRARAKHARDQVRAALIGENVELKALLAGS